MKDIKNSLEKSDTLKIQLTIAINFISSKGTDWEHVMHAKNDNIQIMKSFTSVKIPTLVGNINEG